MKYVVTDTAHRTRRVVVTGLEVDNTPFFLSVSRTQGALLQPWRSALIWIVAFAVTSLAVLTVLAVFVLRSVRDEETLERRAVGA